MGPWQARQAYPMIAWCVLFENRIVFWLFKFFYDAFANLLQPGISEVSGWQC